MQWRPYVTVAAIIRREDRYLLVEEIVDGKTALNQPAGHWEKHESLLDAVRREVLEETTHVFTPKGLVGIYYWLMPESDRTYLRFCFVGKTDGPQPQLSLDPDITTTHWFTLMEIEERIEQLRSPLVLQCIHDEINQTALPLDVIHEV